MVSPRKPATTSATNPLPPRPFPASASASANSASPSTRPNLAPPAAPGPRSVSKSDKSHGKSPSAGSTVSAKTRKTPSKTPTGNTKENQTHDRKAAGKATKRINEVFSRKTFYFDFKARAIPQPAVRQIIEDINNLGGTIEDFFSKDVTTVISDAPEWKIRHPTANPAEVVSPGTPCSLRALANSPWSPADPNVLDNPSNRTSKAKSRTEVIFQRAQIQAKGCDVIENAAKWGIKVWALNKFQNWLDSFKSKHGPIPNGSSVSKAASGGGRSLLPLTNHYLRNHQRSQSVDTSIPQKEPLTGHFLKYEANNCQYRPVYIKFKKFPAVYTDGKPGTSPFYAPDSSRNRGYKRIVKDEEPAIPWPLNVGTTDITGGGDQPPPTKKHRDNHKKDRKHRSPAKPDPAALLAEAQRQQQEEEKQRTKAINQRLLKEEEDEFKPQPGFCEICDKQYSDLANHIHSENHLHLISIQSYWNDLDLCIGLVNANSDDSIIDISDGQG